MKKPERFFTLDGAPIGRIADLSPGCLNYALADAGVCDPHAPIPDVVKTAIHEWLCGDSFLWRKDNLCGFCHPERYRAMYKKPE